MSAIPKNRLSGRVVAIWIGILALAQVADLLTTQVDMAAGGVEANWVAASVMQAGGLALLWIVKLGLVAAMAVAAVLVTRYRKGDSGGRADLVHALVWRGIQGCVLVLAFTALHNVAILGQLQS